VTNVTEVAAVVCAAHFFANSVNFRVRGVPWWALLQHAIMLRRLFFDRRVWYRTLSLRYACIQSSGIVLIS